MTRHMRRTLLLALAVAAAACGDPFDPILTPVPEPREVALVDFVQGDLVDPSAFDILSRSPVRTDQTNGWDFLFLVDEEGQAMFVPRGALLDIETEAGLRIAVLPFDALETAPEDGYVTDEPVPVEAGTVLTMISRANPSFSIRCRQYGKMEVLSIEGTPARLTASVVVNPNCEERGLVEEEDEE